MTALRRRFYRPTGTRPLRKLYVIASEGDKTEPQYFDYFRKLEGIALKILPSRDDSSPEAILRKLKAHLRKEKYERPYEAWLVVDMDRWPERQLENAYNWTQNAPGYNYLAVSRPLFEYWLLLHFENAAGVSTKTECCRKLKRYLQNYSKSNFDMAKLIPGIPEAITRAKANDTPPCERWPEHAGTTVYRLVEKLLSS
ncbi:RloB family protein [bacterium]|nr:RloB family protein [bacterium]